MAGSSEQDDSFEALLDRARTGDGVALDTALREVLPSLDRQARDLLGSWLGGRVGASDVLQEAMVEVVRSIHGFAGTTRGEFVTWLHRIVDRAALRVHRHLSAQKRRPPSTPSGIASLVEAVRPRELATPSGDARAAELEELCAEALRELTVDQRLVAERVLLSGASTEDVARELERTPDAVRALLARARARLALRLEKLGAFDRPGEE